MNNKEKVEKELIHILKTAEDHLTSLAKKIGDLRDAHEFPYMVSTIKKLKKTEKVKNITTAWIQRNFQVGYSRAARLVDELRKMRIIK